MSEGSFTIFSGSGLAALPDGRLLGRAFGRLHVAGAAVVGVWLALPHAAGAQDTPIAVICAVYALWGLALLTGAADRRSTRFFELMLAVNTVVVCVLIWLAGAPASGLGFLFAWVTPWAFAFFTLRSATVLCSWMAGLYAVTLAALLGPDASAQMWQRSTGIWVLTVGSVVAVGALVRWLARSQRSYVLGTRQVMERSQAPMAAVDADMRFVDVNPAACRMLGRDRAELVGMSVLGLTPEADHDLTRMLAAGSSGPVEKRYLRPDGSVIWALVSASPVRTGPDGRPQVTFAVMQDITSQKAAESALRDHARAAERAELTDALTGLANRTLLGDRLTHALARRAQSRAQVAVLVVDLDRFKHINDLFGHRAGDEVLRQVADRITQAVRPGETVARTAADEFVVLCEDLLDVPRDAMLIAAKIIDAVSAPLQITGSSHIISASVGVALPTDADVISEDLLRNADAAMHHAKTRGPGRCELYDDMLRARLVRSVHTEQALRQAIGEGQLRVHYQPIVTCDRQMVAVETLVRWQHPERGLLGPGEFMDVAEDSGLVVPLGRWVLRAACEQAAAWQAQYPDAPALGVTVNVSGAHVASGQLLDDLRDAAAGLELVPGSITLEVTENGLMDRDEACQVLAQVRERAFRVALDDFGTGLSSLSRLRELPLDVLKFDRSFVADLTSDRRAESIVAAVVQMAETLQLTVVAEGVEREEQLDALRSIGCQRIQGFLTGRPVPADQIDERLQRSPVPELV